MLQTFVRQKDVAFFFLKNRVMFHLAMLCFYVDWDIIFKCRHYFKFKKFCFT